MPKAANTTSAELIKRSEELRQQAEALKAKEAPEVLAKIKDAIAHYSFTAEDLGLAAVKAAKKGASKKTSKAVKAVPAKKRKGVSIPTFRDEAGNSWTGFGPKPKWFKEALATGATVESLKV